MCPVVVQQSDDNREVVWSGREEKRLRLRCGDP